MDILVDRVANGSHEDIEKLGVFLSAPVTTSGARVLLPLSGDLNPFFLLIFVFGVPFIIGELLMLPELLDWFRRSVEKISRDTAGKAIAKPSREWQSETESEEVRLHHPALGESQIHDDVRDAQLEQD